MNSSSAHGQLFEGPEWYQKEFLYSVLNLPTYASTSEVRERHRTLSLVYHPDKQHTADEYTHETAKKRFLEVQRAYEVLSDPFLRTVYDTLGYRGLKINLPPHIRDAPLDELPSLLYNLSNALRIASQEFRVNSRGRIIVGFDVRALCRGGGGWAWREWQDKLRDKFGACGIMAFAVRHSFQKDLGPQTRMTIHGSMNQSVTDELDDWPSATLGNGGRIRGNIVACIVHRFSPKLALSLTAPLLRRHRLTLEPSFSDGTNSFSISTHLFPSLFSSDSPSSVFPRPSSFYLPPIDLSFSRRLFPSSLTTGILGLTLNPGTFPKLTIGINRPCVPSSHNKPKSTSVGQSLTFTLRSVAPGPSLAYEHSLAFPPYGLHVRAGFDLSAMGGLLSTVTGEWSGVLGRIGDGGGGDTEGGNANPKIRIGGEETTVGIMVGLGLVGVFARVSISHLGQNIVIPITLASTPDARVAFYATVLPAAAYTVADYFFLRPRRVAERVARRNARRAAHGEYIQQRKREAEETVRLLKESARKHAQAEKSNDGLVIHEATYLPLDENDESISELAVDVSVVLQSLVTNGQLFIPGNRSKSSIHGFFDPLPEFRKRLYIRYEFRGRPHYVEVGDFAPVVLPLKDHLVSAEA